MSMIREAMGRRVLNEANISTKALKFAEVSGLEATQKLREAVNKAFKWNDFDLPMVPAMEANSVKDVVNKYNTLLKKDKSKIEKLFNLEFTGVGRGEVMLAYLFEDISIGGGLQDFDVTFREEAIEVKEVRYSKKHHAGTNFRFGTVVGEYLTASFLELKKLYDVARHYVPHLNTEDFQAKVARGEMALTDLREFDLSSVTHLKELGVIINSDGYVIHGENDILGNMADGNIWGKLEPYFKVDKNVKTFGQIEKDLAKKISSSSELKGLGYFFFAGQKGGSLELFYEKSFPKKIRISRATGYKVYVDVKLS